MEQIKSVLIVEDDPFIATSIATLLEEHNFEIIAIVNTAEKAWKICLATQPCLIILDINLKSDLNGTWVGKNILKHDLNTKIIYLTAHDDSETIKEIELTNASLFVTKPFKESMLMTNINMVMQQNKCSKSIEIFDSRTLHVINPHKVLYIQSEGNYLNIFFCDLPQLIIRKKLVDLIDYLPDSIFLRIHQSFVINTLWVEHADVYNITIKGNKIPISRSYKPIVKKYFNIKS